MKKIYFLTLAMLGVFHAGFAYQQEAEGDTAIVVNADSLVASYLAIDTSFTYQTGLVTIGDDLAVINIPEGFKFMNKEQSRVVLEDIWGNPEDESTLGMLFPEDGSPIMGMTYAIEISYAEEGYIDDEDAEDIDYEELLEEMQASAMEESEQRRNMGYLGYELIGWATPPYYDAENKKLHWAKEVKFDEDETSTLNYNIRILGREGYLLLNGIGELEYLDDMNKSLEPVLASVEFTDGNRYQDFDPEYDKVAAYGIGGLIAGKVLSKVGFFAVIAKFWKFILVGGAAALGGIKKFFGGKSSSEA